jgi:hypothetical protein
VEFLRARYILKLQLEKRLKQNEKNYLSYQAIRQIVLVIKNELTVKTIFRLVENVTILLANILYAILPV